MLVTVPDVGDSKQTIIQCNIMLWQYNYTAIRSRTVIRISLICVTILCFFLECRRHTTAVVIPRTVS